MKPWPYPVLAKENVFRVFIAWYKHEKSWENSRRLCKPDTSRRFAQLSRKEENIVEFLEGRIRNQKLSSVHEKKLSIHLNFPFPFVSFNGVFLTLKCENLVLKTTTWCDSQLVWFTALGPCFILSLNMLFQPIRLHVISELYYKLKQLFTIVSFPGGRFLSRRFAAR